MTITVPHAVGRESQWPGVPDRALIVDRVAGQRRVDLTDGLGRCRQA
jgi:hypothetical protein